MFGGNTTVLYLGYRTPWICVRWKHYGPISRLQDSKDLCQINQSLNNIDAALNSVNSAGLIHLLFLIMLSEKILSKFTIKFCLFVSFKGTVHKKKCVGPALTAYAISGGRQVVLPIYYILHETYIIGIPIYSTEFFVKFRIFPEQSLLRIFLCEKRTSDQNQQKQTCQIFASQLLKLFSMVYFKNNPSVSLDIYLLFLFLDRNLLCLKV